MSRSGVLLAAHGAHRDPAAEALVHSLARRLHAAGAADEVVAGFHQGTPGFGEALDRLSACRVLVIPLFTAQGYFTDHVLPASLAQGERAALVRLRQSRPIGADPRLLALVVRRLRRLAAEHRLAPDATSLLVVGHGTSRNRRSRDTTVALTERLRRAGIAAEVASAFLDEEPDIETALERFSRPQVLVLPFLLGGGAHAAMDLPERLGIPGPLGLVTPLDGVNGSRRIVVDVPLGGYPELADLLLEIAREELPPVAVEEVLPAGTVALVGAGPGDPGLITVRGLACLRSADVVLHDRLAAPELLAEVRRDAQVISVGKTVGGGASQEHISALLVAHALAGKRVVRLKGGDPFVFGRGSEELDACRAAGVPCVVVSGVTSAVAVPAAAGIPVTARGESRSFAVVTAQTEDGELPAAVTAQGGNPAIDTLVLLMGRAALHRVVAAQIAAGRDPDTPAACVASGTTPAQRVTVATLATIAAAADRDGLEAPVVTVIGEVAARAAGVTAAC